MLSEKVRVLIVDDSAICRSALRVALESDEEVQVVGEASDGMEAVRLVEALKPSLVTMDLQMPRMGGLETIELIMRRRPTPILVVTDRPRVEGVDMTFASLSRGALDLLPKATSWRVGSPEATALVTRVKQVAREAYRPRSARRLVPDRSARPQRTSPTSLIGIGASTGGPNALCAILRELPSGFPLPILVVQHMDRQFEESFVQWLGKQCALPVKMARDDEAITPGEIRVAPQGTDLVVEGGRTRLRPPRPGSMHVPAVDRLFTSLAASYGENLVAVLLTGMGKDGAQGLKAIRERDGFCVVQDEATSAVWGMPGAAVEIGAAAVVLPLPEISALVRGCALPPERNSSTSEAGSLASRNDLEGVSSMNKQKILLVDDSQVILEAGRMALEEAGFEVSTLENPLSLATVIRKTLPDLVLLDVNMPAVTGDVVAQIIGRHGVASSVPLVLYSDISPSELEVRAQKCGARGFIQKTGDEEALVSAVRQFLTAAPAPRAR